MTPLEIYLPDDRYNFCVEFIADAIRRPTPDVGERYDRLHVALRCAGIDMGKPELIAGQVRPTLRTEIVDDLMTLEPDVLGRFDDDDVKWVLSAHNIWPMRIREHAEGMSVGVSILERPFDSSI